MPQPCPLLRLTGRWENCRGRGIHQISGETRNHLARLNPDGTLDTTFIDPEVRHDSVYSVTTQPDGKILIGGWFSEVGGVPRGNIARLEANGALDPSFHPNANYPVASIALQTDGKIVITGEFTLVGGVERNNLARLNPGGSLDPNFDAGANSWVLTAAIQADGKVLAGGSFTTLGGLTRGGIARITNTDAALQELTVNPYGSVVTWTRGQASPEVNRVVFEYSVDGTAWNFLGNGTRISGGWELGRAFVSFP